MGHQLKSPNQQWLGLFNAEPESGTENSLVECDCEARS